MANTSQNAVQQPEPPLTTQELQTKPWKYIGYRGFSAWAASDKDFFVIRRFDSLAVRVVLSLQWKIIKLEKDLMQMDSARSQRTARDFDNGSFEGDDDERQSCLASIRECLSAYYDFISQYKNLRSEPLASAHNQSNVQNWLKSHNGAIRPEESAFIEGHDDLFSITATIRTPLRSALEKSNFFIRSKHLRRNCPIPEEASTYPYDPRKTIYQADKKIDSLVNIVICLVGFLMLVAPLWILISVHSRRHQLAIITICIALFLAIVQSVIVARPFDSLAATAAYAAVLMVFIQIGS